MEETTFPIDVVLDSAETPISRSGSPRDNPLFTLDPPIDNVVGLSVLTAQLPFSYYVVDAFTQQLEITIDGSTYRVYLEMGSFTPSTISTMFQNVITFAYSSSTPRAGGVEMVSGGGAVTDLNTEYGFRLLCDETNSRSVIYISDSGEYTTSFTLNMDIAYSCRDILGFGAQSYASAQSNVFDSVDALIANTHNVVSTYTFNLSGPSYLFLHSSMAANLPFGAVRNLTTSTDMIQDVIVNQNYRGILQFVNNFPVKIPFTSTRITNFDLFWTLGTRTRFGLSQSAATTHVQLLGQPFQVKIRFYVKLQSVERSILNYGDRFTSSVSNTTGNRDLSNKRIRRDDVRK